MPQSYLGKRVHLLRVDINVGATGASEYGCEGAMGGVRGEKEATLNYR
jgi:hypothetical protein